MAIEGCGRSLFRHTMPEPDTAAEEGIRVKVFRNIAFCRRYALMKEWPAPAAF